MSRPYDNLFIFLSFTFKLSVKDMCGKCTAIRQEVICQCDFECKCDLASIGYIVFIYFTCTKKKTVATDNIESR